MKRFFAMCCCVVLIWACSSDDSIGVDNPTSEVENPDKPSVETGFDRSAMLINWADNIIVPAYEAFSSEVANLNAAFENFQADTSEANLLVLRTSWLNAYQAWQKVDMFEIGPAETVGLRLNVNIYPADVEQILILAGTQTYDLTLSSNRDVKGFAALDFLINGLGEDDSAIVAKFSGLEKEVFMSYTEAVLADMTTLSNQVVTEWKQGYRDTFVNADGSSATASVDRFTNDYVFYYEKFLRAGKLGIPLGVFSGVQSPNTVEAYYSPDTANLLFLTGLDAAQDFFNGKHFDSDTNGESMASYLRSLDRNDLGDDINARFDASRTAVSALAPFRTELETSNPAVNMLSAFEAVQKAVPLFKVDMFSAMSISVDFVDADGD